MKVLAIDCATEACSVALFEGGTLIASDYSEMGRGHAEALVPMIAALPGKGLADQVLVALGPGSFTGVRVGLAAARALGLAWQVPVLGYPTLALVAAMARAQAGPQPLCTVMTGGHGEWFVARFDEAGRALGSVVSLSPDDAAQACGEELVAGSQAAALVERRGHGTALPLLPDARAALLLGPADWQADLAPIYGRPPDARLPGIAPQ